MNACAVLMASVLPLMDCATNALARRIAGADPAVCLARFAAYPPSRERLGSPRGLALKPFPANERFWLKDVDFSCASPWNDACGAQRAGTLISRRHVIFAKHFPLKAGTRILFVDREGEVCPCRIAATKALENCDIMIGSLDYEVTPGIRPAKILPADCVRLVGDGKGLPVVTFNQREQAFLSQLNGISTNATGGVSNGVPDNPDWKPLGGRLVVGDSGNPAFLLVGKEPILLYCLFSGGVGHGPSVFHRRGEIQRAMDELCPGYELEAFRPDASVAERPPRLRGDSDGSRWTVRRAE